MAQTTQPSAADQAQPALRPYDRRVFITFLVILILAAVSRFYNLGARVMSHDESLHSYFSWQLAQGSGYQHTPVTHGPLQFHLLALVDFIFGDTDFTARIPAAIFSILSIALLWKDRRYLGNAGTLAAAFLMLISPYMLFYGRYTRNEAFVVVFALLFFYAILRYLESGEVKFLWLMTTASALHFTAKETAFIYTAQALLFLTVVFVVHTAHTARGRTIQGVKGWAAWLRADRAFTLMILLVTEVLPQASPVMLKLLGYNPIDYSTAGIQRAVLALLPFLAVTILIGCLWNPRLWFVNEALFLSIYIFFYTTMFSNGGGFFTGLIGSLGYWLEQQSVHRGSQPWYYYFLIQIPFYEFLPAAGSIAAAVVYLRKKITVLAEVQSHTPGLTGLFLPLTFWWAISSLVAFSIAGEKMPWLTVHIIFPMLILSGWAFGQIVTALRMPANSLQMQPARWARGGLGAVGTVLFVLLVGLTVRSSILSSYVNYDSGRELDVYAHGAADVKKVMNAIDLFSFRVKGDRSIPIAFGSETAWPITWYLRWFPNTVDFIKVPDTDLTKYAIIIAGEAEKDKVQEVLGDRYAAFPFTRIVWPNQDYFHLTFARLHDSISDPEMRLALFNIWMYRDYQQYVRVTNNASPLQDADWQPSARMIVYIQKDYLPYWQSALK